MYSDTLSWWGGGREEKNKETVYMIRNLYKSSSYVIWYPQIKKARENRVFLRMKRDLYKLKETMISEKRPI